jgi:hypothetical protein
MERKKINLNSSKSKSDVNINTFTNVNFVANDKELPPGEINYVLNVGEQLNIERNLCTRYRFIFTINPLFTNVLMNPAGTTNWDSDNGGSENGNGLDVFDQDTFKTNAYSNEQFDSKYKKLNYLESVNENLIERDGWFGFIDPDITKPGIKKFFNIEPTKKRFDLNDNIKKNWDVCISYPSSTDNQHHVVKDGLLIVNIEKVTVGGKSMVALGTATRHGLSTGEKVRVSDMSDNQLNGEFTVKRVGLDNGDYKENYFAIDVDPTIISTTPNTISGRMVRYVNGYESEYYLRKFKKFTDIDYSIYPLAFSNTIFNDQNYQVTFNKEVDISDLKDNLGRPLSELYLTIVKTRDDNFMSQIKSGLDLEYLSGNLNDIKLSNIRRIHNGSSTPFTTHTPLNPDVKMGVLSADTEFYGDVVEYNKTELVENILSDVLHRFNTSKRDSSTQNNKLAKGSRREGYMYKPHYEIPIRFYSSFIEQGYTATTGNIPDYSEELNGGKYIWRDLLTIGTSLANGETLEYPFTNNSHYIYDNICFVMKRQDPFNLYGLYYGGDSDKDDPADPRGERITDKFVTKNSEDVC